MHSDLKGLAAGRLVLAEVGSMSMEYTRLAQITGERKYFDLVRTRFFQPSRHLIKFGFAHRCKELQIGWIKIYAKPSTIEV